ncbi:DUF1385 domain-containing protein [Candidatus Woesearchaeota archaeon]|nr:MAG: DUF1385 domain-containing protein [Candidatus Woesearchaeota archaeon]
MEELLLGGQAVIEGVMMKGKNHYAVAVRKNDGEILVDHNIWDSLTQKLKIFSFPIIRGVVSLVEMMVLGIRTLTYSANVAAEDMDENLSGTEIFFTILVSLLFSALLFILLPLFLSGLIINNNNIWFNILDGVLRILIFIGYVLAIGMMNDVKTLFEYHGAEHKTVHAYEAKVPLTVKNVKKYSTLHPRCGTSFVFIVLIVSIIVFSLVRPETFLMKLVSRLTLIPLIAGISYEILKISAKKKDSFLFKLIVLPGLGVQKLTTREPSNKQLEVSIESIKKVIALEAKK